MTNMGRRLWRIAVGVAVMLWIGVFSLLIRSYFSMDMLSATTAGRRHLELLTIPGQIRLTTVSNWPMESEGVRYRVKVPSGQFVIFGQRPIYQKWYFLAIGVTDGSARISDDAGKPITVTFRTIAIPLEFLLLPLTIAPVWLIWQARRRRLLRTYRLAHCLCLTCGYDLRASPGQCPECGVQRHLLPQGPK